MNLLFSNILNALHGSLTLYSSMSALWKGLGEESPAATPQAPAFDHTLVPQRIGDVLVGHNGETDRFVFNDPSMSASSRIMTVAEVEEQGARYIKDYRVAHKPVLIRNFNPNEGDVLDFSQLQESLSFSGTTPQANSVWLSGRHPITLDYMLEIDLDDNPQTTEMYILLAPTEVDMFEAEWDWDDDGIIDAWGLEARQTKTIDADALVFA